MDPWKYEGLNIVKYNVQDNNIYNTTQLTEY
jgi:hypothetical protein